MLEKGNTLIEIDLNQFKLHIRNKDRTVLSLHFDSPSRRFYLSIIALVANEMKKLGKVTSIALEDHYDTLALLNETIGNRAGSSERKNLLRRIYRKWKEALPDLEHAPLFTIPGRRKEYGGPAGKTYSFTDEEKDAWANLFEYKGSHENVRLNFSIDRLGATLDQMVVTYGEEPNITNEYSWDRFIESLKRELSDPNSKDKGPVAPTPRKRSWWRPWPWRSLGVVVGLLLMGVIVAIWYFSFHKPKSASDGFLFADSPLPLPDKPSIAVLPFVNMSGDPEQEYLSDGISEEIINALSKSSKLFVIARESSFSYKGKQAKVPQIARELGVRYILEGSVRKSEDRVRIGAQLIDGIKGEHLWSERYDRDLQDIFALQDEITMKIVTALRIELTVGEQARIWGKKMKNLDVLLKSLEVLSLWNKGTRESFIRHGQVAQEIIDMAPDSAVGYKSLAWHYWYLTLGGTRPQESIGKAFNLAQKALSFDESDAHSHALLGAIYLVMRQYEEAIAAGERSIALYPNGALVHGLLGRTLIFAGRPDEATAHLKQGIRLNPFPAYWYYRHLGLCYMHHGQYEMALTELKKALHRSPDSVINNLSLAVIYILLDRQEEARSATKKVLELNPEACMERAKKAWPYKHQADLKFVVNAMRKAGLPDCPPRQASKKAGQK